MDFGKRRPEAASFRVSVSEAFGRPLTHKTEIGENGQFDGEIRRGFARAYVLARLPKLHVRSTWAMIRVAMNRDRMWSVRLELREAVLRWDAPLTQFSSPSYPELFSGVSPTFPASQHVSASVPPPLPGSQLLDDPILPSLPREEYPFTFNTFGVEIAT
ncbi:hypothetical protein B0H13DRAFT_1886364 [Mycena leptocephala]|nr:hypothetical protein B0H13DRAFT_1886364 [Mycena leptocephala]